MRGRTSMAREEDEHSTEVAPTPDASPRRYGEVLRLQQAAGNAATSRLLVQPKLLVGRAGDRSEAEADRVADGALRALGSPDTHAIRRASARGEDVLGGLPVDASTESRIDALRGRGKPLDGETRAAMESGFAADFSAVRVHADGEADALNRQLEARAFSTGSDIFFRRGGYEPHSSTGRALLAHELAHVTQQAGATTRAETGVVQRTFEPANANLESITEVQRLEGGLMNKGVFVLIGEGGQQLVAKFVDEDPRRAQMADIVLGTAGVGSAASHPHGMDYGARVLAQVRRVAEGLQATDPDRAQALLAGADRAAREAKAVVMMKKMEGIDLGDLIVGSAANATEKDRGKATKSGIDIAQLYADPMFHNQLGRLYVADALLGGGDRFAMLTKGYTKVNTKNLKVTAQGYINTFDSDTVAIAYETLENSKAKEKGADAWAKWLLEGGKVWDLGLEAPEAFTQDLLRMFDRTSRETMFNDFQRQFVSDARVTFPALAFATFDASFFAGIQHAATLLVAKIDDLVSSAGAVGGDDRGAGAIDAGALAVKLEFMKGLLPDLQQGEVSEQSKQRAYAAAKAKAARIVKARERAAELASFDNTLLPVPPRPAKLGRAERGKRAVGNLFKSVAGKDKDRLTKAKRAEKLRKGSSTLGVDELDKAHQEVAAMGNQSDRQQRANFELGLQRAVLSIHKRANVFGNADMEFMTLSSTVADPRVVREELDPVRKANWRGAVTNFKTLAAGYRAQLTRSTDRDDKESLTRAERELDTRADEFEAAIDFVERKVRDRERVSTG